MGKVKRDKKLYSRMRASGVRKRVARRLSELPAHVRGGKQAPKQLREAVERLEATASELREHARRGDRGASARKAARTRRAKAKSRSASARKAARSRSK
jgi:prephenate dehydrogenase